MLRAADTTRQFVIRAKFSTFVQVLIPASSKYCSVSGLWLTTGFHYSPLPTFLCEVWSRETLEYLLFISGVISVDCFSHVSGIMLVMVTLVGWLVGRLVGWLIGRSVGLPCMLKQTIRFPRGWFLRIMVIWWVTFHAIIMSNLNVSNSLIYDQIAVKLLTPPSASVVLCVLC